MTNGYIKQWSASTNAQYTLNFYIKFSDTKYKCIPSGGNTDYYSTWFGYSWGLTLRNLTTSSVYVGRYATASNYGGWFQNPQVIIELSGF